MDKNYPMTDRIELIAAHLRLIADLMLAGKDLKDVDRAAFALVMEDLSARLEQALREKVSVLLAETCMEKDSQP